MAKTMRAVNEMMATAKKKKQLQESRRAMRTTAGPLTDEARDWTENNAGVQRQRELERRIPNPVTRKKLEKERPMTTLNKWHGPVHTSENEALLNSNSREQYNQNVNLTTARNTLMNGLRKQSKRNKDLRQKRSEKW